MELALQGTYAGLTVYSRYVDRELALQADMQAPLTVAFKPFINCSQYFK